MVDARLFQALSDSTRLKILLLLSRSTMNVTSIVNEVKASQPAVSRHLRVLREASLINHVRKGKEIEYSINLPQLKDAKLYIEALTGGTGEGEGPQVVELAVPVAAKPAAAVSTPAATVSTPGTTPRTAKRRKTRGARVAGKPAAKPSIRPTLKEPGQPATVTAIKEYVVEREDEDSMDDFLL